MPAYVDPCKHVSAPTLLAGLMAAPTKVGLQPLENQVTTILAWLLARSERFARSFCELFLTGPAATAVDASPRIGVRTWITLPSLPGTGRLYPDLSLEGCDGLFQLLVEIKVHAGLHQFAALDGLWQPEAYIAAWKQEESGAAIRQVGTLSRGGSSYRPPLDAWRAADVTWASVRELVVAENFPAEIRAVAEEFGLVLDAVILETSVGITSELATWARAFLNRVAVDLNQRVEVSKVGGIVSGKDYVGRYVSFAGATDTTFRLWFAVTEKHARYNQPLHDQFAWISSADNDKLPPDLPTKLEAAGFSWLKDRAGWGRWRRGEPVAALSDAGPIERQAAILLRAYPAWQGPAG